MSLLTAFASIGITPMFVMLDLNVSLNIILYLFYLVCFELSPRTSGRLLSSQNRAPNLYIITKVFVDPENE